jgi:D-alanyl-D-alanine dipeptidase
LGKNYYYAMVRKKPITDPSLREAALNLTSPTIWLRQSIAHDLRLVDAALAEYGLRLYLLSGYRSPDLQRLVRQLATIEQEREFTERMLANPEVHLSHATGAAFDIEIWEQTTERLLPTKIPEHFERDYLESKPDLTPAEIEVRDNRRLIHNILTTDVVLPSDRIFIPHPFEYWHYARHEKLSTVFATFYGIAHEAFYPEIPAHLLPQQQAES